MARLRRGRPWWPWLVLAIALALWWRVRDHATSPLPTGPVPARMTPPPEPDAGLDARIRPTQIEDRPDAAAPRLRGPGSGFTLLRLSSDGRHALLADLATRPRDLPRYRSVTVDSGAIDAEVALPSRVVASIDDPPQPYDAVAHATQLAKELIAARALLRGFPFGAGDEIASSPDGTLGAYNEGDDLHTVNGDKLGPKIALPAAYDPLILSDGATLLMRGYDGETDGPGTGKYSLFAMPLAGGKLKKVATTDGMTGQWAVAKSGDTLRIVVSQPPKIPPCVLEVALAKPLHVTSRHCVDKADEIALSPSGDWVAWQTQLEVATRATLGSSREANWRVRAMELATGAISIDATTDPAELAIGDTGRLVVQQRDTIYDLTNGRTRKIALPVPHIALCLFRGASELVCERDGSVALIDVATLPALQE